MGLFSFDPLTFGGYDLSDPSQVKIFQSQLAQYLNQLQYAISQLVGNPSYAASTLNFKSFFSGTVTTNQTIDCTGAVAVAIDLIVTTNFSPLVTFNNLGLAVPVTFAFSNNFSGAVTLTVAATQPGGTAYTGVFWKTSANTLVDMSVGISVANGTSVLAAGASAPNTNWILFMLVN